MNIRAEHQMDRPLALVDEREAAPWVLLVGLHVRLEDPVLDQQHVCEVCSLLAEAKVCCTVVQVNVISQPDRNLHNRLGFTELSRSCSSDLKESDRELLMRAVFDQNLVMVAIHEVDSASNIDFSDQHFVLGLEPIVICILDNVTYLANLGLR